MASFVNRILLQKAIRIAAVAIIVLIVLIGRVVVSSRHELRQADTRYKEGDIDSAIVHYRRAARWYAPFSPFHKDALIKLERIGRRAKQEGDIERALMAFRAIRAAIMSTRSFYIPEPDRLARANGTIAELMAALPPPSIDAGKSKDQLRKEHLALLEQKHGPDVFWTSILLIGFIGWVVGAFIFASRAVGKGDRLLWNEARRWGILIILGFGLFILGMIFA